VLEALKDAEDTPTDEEPEERSGSGAHGPPWLILKKAMLGPRSHDAIHTS